MKIRARWLIRLLARVIALVSRVLFRTLRIDVRPAVPGASPYEDSGEVKHLYCIWHDAILCAIFGGRSVSMAALVSTHGDGSYVADALDCVNITPIRGSSGRRGAAALREMMEAARGKDITIATDGPRGPRRLVKDGIVFLASQTGRAIVPVAVAAQSAWRPRGRWTDLVVPKPYSRLMVLGGTPITVPAGLSREQIAQYRNLVQQSMDELSARAEVELRGSGSPVTTADEPRRLRAA